MGSGLRAKRAFSELSFSMVRAEVGLQEVPERRRGTRYLVQLPVSYRSAGGSTRGTILDISATGAAVEGTPPHEQLGGALVLQFECFGTIEPIGLNATLVRLTDRGFAVQFSEPEPFLKALLKIAMLHMEQSEARAPAGGGS